MIENIMEIMEGTGSTPPASRDAMKMGKIRLFSPIFINPMNLCYRLLNKMTRKKLFD